MAGLGLRVFSNTKYLKATGLLRLLGEVLWNLPLEPRVLKAWQTVASKRVDCKLQVVTEMLGANNVVITPLGDAIHHLMLLNTVIHPNTLWQIQKETAYQSKSRYP